MRNKLLCLVCLFGFAFMATAAQTAIHEFFRGKTVRLIVGAAPGGGFDTYSRTIARHMGKHVPGNPTFIVENMPCFVFLDWSSIL